MLQRVTLSRRAAVEGVGTALLLAGIVGSGIMAERLAGGNVAVALLANTLATGGVLVAVILAFGPISGAHFNPVVTLADAWRGGLKWSDATAYIAAQIVGAVAGVSLANVMFGEPVLFASHHGRHGLPILLSEFVATFGLLSIVWGCSRSRSNLTAFAVAAYIVGAYWFTASTSFANPAVTIARSLSDTFAGIAPADIPGFIAAELGGALAATALFGWVTPQSTKRSSVDMKRSVLFVCVHNSARSQMAEAFLNAQCSDDFRAESAGLEPGTLNSLAVAAMSEAGFDISKNATKSAFELFKDGRQYSYVITVCDETAAERCPVFPGGARQLHWSFPDPAALEGTWDQRLDKARAIRDQIRARIDAWCSKTCDMAVTA
ncbi:MAG TPA: aquaporin [Candidatus Baltobacteraceae bacterium]|nr:aquaporin [Candidatus Baltobacteraceae bacterium]